MRLSSYQLTVALSLAPIVLGLDEVQAIHYLAPDQLQRSAYPEADSFRPLQLAITDQERELIAERSDSKLGKGDLRIWEALKNGQRLGYVVVDDVLGKHDFITFGFQISLTGSIQGLEIMEYREAKGGEVVRPEWRAQFNGQYMTQGLELGQAIQNISGATISCKHITDRLRAWIALYQLVLK